MYSMMDSTLDQGHLSKSTGTAKTDVKLSDFICQAEVSWWNGCVLCRAALALDLLASLRVSQTDTSLAICFNIW